MAFLETFQNLNLQELKALCRGLKEGQRLAGYFSYEWGAALEGIAPANSEDALKLPPNWFGLYERDVFNSEGEPRPLRARVPPFRRFGPSALAASPLQGASARGMNPARLGIITPRGKPREILKLKKGGVDGDVPHSGNVPLTPTHTFHSSFTKEDYFQAVQKILDYLQAGDCYQVNLTQRFTTTAQEDPQKIYRRLCTVSPAPYACFLDCGDFQILSSSPECFLKADADGTLTTRPIKGTRRRGSNLNEDENLKAELLASPKDNAELLMITDLERNDLGKICEPGTVTVPQLKKIETFAQVHHLVATVQGRRRKDKDILDVLAAMLPGGSITGAPKIRAMQIIQELEPVNRGVYTGAIGWIGPNNTACFNVAIRTLVIQNQKAFFNAGGGIVIDSNPEKEYEESLIKAGGMREALGL